MINLVYNCFICFHNPKNLSQILSSFIKKIGRTIKSDNKQFRSMKNDKNHRISDGNVNWV